MARVDSHCRICGTPLDSSAVAGECLACRTKSTELSPVSHFAETRVDQDSANALHGEFQADLKDQLGYLPQAPEGFRIIQEIGRGGTSLVFLAEQSGMARHVAIKYLMHFHVFKQGERLEREARALGQLDHPNILKIYNCVLKTANPFLVMEYAGGGSVSDEIKKYQNGLPIERAKAWAIELASAMVAAHKAGIVHRDLKPGNVLINAEGHLKVADFGLARNLESDPTITKTEAVLGTPAFMSPEQAMGQVPTKSCDIYGIGATLYAMVTGRPPHAHSQDPQEAIRTVIRDDPTPPGKLRKGLPRDFATIIETCLERSPSKRYATVQDLYDDLVRFNSGEHITARPVTGLTRTIRKARRHKKWFATAAAIVIIAILLGLLTRKKDNQVAIILKDKKKIEFVSDEYHGLIQGKFGNPMIEYNKNKKSVDISSIGESLLTVTDDPGYDEYLVRISFQVLNKQVLNLIGQDHRSFRCGLVVGHNRQFVNGTSIDDYYAYALSNVLANGKYKQLLTSYHMKYQIIPMEHSVTNLAFLQDDATDTVGENSVVHLALRVADSRFVSQGGLAAPKEKFFESNSLLFNDVAEKLKLPKPQPRASIGLSLSNAHMRILSFSIEK